MAPKMSVSASMVQRMTEQRNDGMNDAGDPSLDLPMEYLLHEFEVTPDRGLHGSFGPSTLSHAALRYR